MKKIILKYFAKSGSKKIIGIQSILKIEKV